METGQCKSQNFGAQRCPISARKQDALHYWVSCHGLANPEVFVLNLTTPSIMDCCAGGDLLLNRIRCRQKKWNFRKIQNCTWNLGSMISIRVLYSHSQQFNLFPQILGYNGYFDDDFCVPSRIWQPLSHWVVIMYADRWPLRNIPLGCRSE